MFPSKVSRLWLIPIVLAVAWLVYVYTAISQPLWENWMILLVSGISVVVFPFAWYAIIKSFGSRFVRLNGGHLVTRDELFRIVGNRIDVSNLKDVESLRFKEHDNEIEIWQGGQEEKIFEPDPVNAKKLHNVFDDWKVTAGPGLIANLTERSGAYNRSRALAMSLAGFVAAALVGGLFAAVFVKWNRYSDDEDTWARAQAVNSIDQYDDYKARHPYGRHAVEADSWIAGQISKLRDDYAARALKNANPEAVNAMTSLINEAIARPDRTIFLKVTEDRQLADAVVGEIQQELGTYVQGYESSVPTNAFVFRQNKVFSDLKVMMNGAFTSGGLKLELVDDVPPEAPRSRSTY